MIWYLAASSHLGLDMFREFGFIAFVRMDVGVVAVHCCFSNCDARLLQYARVAFLMLFAERLCMRTICM